MKLFDKLFGKADSNDDDEESDNNSQHCVAIFFHYGKEDIEPFYDLEDELLLAIDKKNAGQYDWHEMNEDHSDGALYMYGPNAEVLFNTVKPILERTDFMKGATAVLRFGPEGVDSKEKVIEIRKK